MSKEKLVDEIDTAFGAFIYDARMALRLPINYVSARTGIPKKRLNSLELGNAKISIRHDEIVALARILAIDTEYLIQKATGEI